MKSAEVNLKTHPLSGVSLIEASAGTGKTYTITRLYVRCLLETDHDVQQILIVTFTNAATQELKGRIRDYLYEVTHYLSDATIEDSQLEELFSGLRGSQDAILKLKKALSCFDEAGIYSIHGFCQRLIQRFPIETQSLLQSQVISDEFDLELAASRDFWRRHIISSEIKLLRWILTQWDGPEKLLTAVRPLLGFPKTVEKKASQIKKNRTSEGINEVWEKLQQAWFDNEDEISAVLLHSKAINRNAFRPATVEKLICEFSQVIIDDIPYKLSDKWDLLTCSKLKSSLKKGAQDTRLENPFFKSAELFGELHPVWIHQQKIEIVIAASRSIREQVNKAKNEAALISFNDMIDRVSGVIPDNHPLIERVNALYPVAMVDEFQDTDLKQYKIFTSLSKKGMTLIMIGDPKQAIYSFRGADVFTYQRAKQDTEKQFTLNTNYRSSAEFVDLINTIFSKNADAFIFKSLINFYSTRPDKESEKTFTEMGDQCAPMVCWMHPYTKTPLIKEKATRFFSNQCAREIAHLLEKKTLSINREKVMAKDLAILVRTGRQASLMKKRLAELGIASALISRDSIFATHQAMEISLLLQVLIDPSSISRLNGLLTTDLFAWNTQEIEQMQYENHRLVRLLEQINNYQELWRDKGILAMFFSLIKEQQTLQKNQHHLEAERRVTNWLHIIELLQQQTSKHASPVQTLHWLQQQRDNADDFNAEEDHQLRLEDDRDLVRIITIHKSKGLEYPIVFLPFIWDVRSNKKPPENYSYHDDAGNKKIMILDDRETERWQMEQRAEEVRLFYVAMTRAKYRCYLGWGHISGAGNSALADCLYPGKTKSSRNGLDLDLVDSHELEHPFQQLNKDRSRVELVEMEIAKPAAELKVKQSAQQPTVRQFNRILRQQWRISSYSQIATTSQHAEIDRPDYDAVSPIVKEDEMAEIGSEMNRFTFHKGAKAGNFLHELLELQPFHLEIDNNLIQQKCVEYGYDSKWQPILVDWLADILQCDLGQLSLCQLKPAQQKKEMEFLMSSNHLRSDELNRLLEQHHYIRPGQELMFTQVKGFLQGFIDLAFEYRGEYFIVDYKSNYLGASQSQYSQAHCQDALYAHHYHLQYLIYSLALHRYLKSRKADYSYERHFGGSYYLFLRGMSAKDNMQNGIYFHKPEHSVIEQLDRILG